MDDLSSTPRSLWTVDADASSHPPLAADTTVDVAVVGGGITGTTTALMCKDAGLTVALLEADTIASGTTGGTTGKVTSQHQLFYASAVEEIGTHAARLYAEANQASISMLLDLADQHGAQAWPSRLPSFVYTREQARVPDLQAEVAVAARLGLPASFVDDVGLPFEVAGAVRFDDQLQVHPTRLVHGLARAVAGDGSSVHEHSRVVRVAERGDHVEVRTRRATVRARHAVIATLLPIADQGFEFARTRPTRSYAIAVQLDEEPPEPMYISADSPTRSLRHYHGNDGVWLVVVGQAHETGHGADLADNHVALEEFARTHFAVRSVTHRWSSQDYLPVDGVPYVGRLSFTDRIQVATGFKKWGLSNGPVAARIMTDAILERDNPWAGVFDANRLPSASTIPTLAKDNLHVARRFVGDRLGADDAPAPDDLPSGQGRVVRTRGRHVAMCRTRDGVLHVVDATCTHLGCLVAWNDAETSWDCPCHGSRFAPDGQVITGPAVRPLRARTAP
ncbi:FAD-dependent oxidoreductase [Salsipaludibacter albus]|uniref:FAD-dependent oxidoreductase n=1 Tax=Salsipaludibacter albus TaxID=2849650 RepID=UPI001EE49C72|nr:FAD-dependent oxidoreductase [Salsipaludibacter albus]MBY5161364.1 FAD-dependent oxidoreductase [Salsipaludibacter albus]